MMIRKTIAYLSAPIALFLFLATSFFLSSMQVRPSSSEQPSFLITPPDVPTSISFANETIDLTDFDKRERMDRELMAFSYMHSTSLQILKKANRFFPIIEPILKANGVPDDLKYLMVIESNLNTQARSRAGAAGLWQFMPATAREFGLEVNRNIDERYNLSKSTVAACKYLKEAKNRYGSWITAAASYNAGQGRISSELNRQQVDTALDLWLVEETSRYMFRILAAKQLLSNPKTLGFKLKREQLYPPIPCKEVKVTYPIDNLVTFAKKHNVTYAQLKEFNPWLRERTLENRSGRTYLLLIPEKVSYNPKEIPVHNKKWIE